MKDKLIIIKQRYPKYSATLQNFVYLNLSKNFTDIPDKIHNLEFRI